MNVIDTTEKQIIVLMGNYGVGKSKIAKDLKIEVGRMVLFDDNKIVSTTTIDSDVIKGDELTKKINDSIRIDKDLIILDGINSDLFDYNKDNSTLYQELKYITNNTNYRLSIIFILTSLKLALKLNEFRVNEHLSTYLVEETQRKLEDLYRNDILSLIDNFDNIAIIKRGD